MKVRSILCSLALTAACSTLSFAQITGTVKLDGKAPEMKPIDMSGVKDCAARHADPVPEETVVASDKGELKNVIVYLKTEEGQTVAGDASKEPAVLDQEGCMYTPHVVAMMAGQTLVIKNSDPFMHNVHSLAEVNPAFNQAQPNVDKDGIKVDNIKSPEVFHVKCDVHGWMSAYVGVFDTPYFATTGDDGKYTIKADQLPDGEYTFVAWHEKFGKNEQKVTVKDHKATADFTVKAEAAQANPAGLPVTEIKLASMTKDGAKGEGCEKGECCSEANRANLAKKADVKPAAQVAAKAN
jgi:hypothetical protein